MAATAHAIKAPLEHLATPPLVLQLAEDRAPDTIQLFRTGTFFHPDYGKFDITPQMLSEMVQNFRANVRGVDLAIDYAHDAEGEAAAWIKDVFLKEDNQQLWARVAWTEGGRAKVEGKNFRYISPDFSFKSRDPETLQLHGPTLNGAALTNRPFLKRMAPVIRLSELSQKDTEEEDDMTLEEAKARIKELEGSVAKLSEASATLASLQKDLGDASPADLNARIKELEGQVESQSTQLSELRRKNSDAAAEVERTKKNGEFDLLLKEGKVVEAQREAFMKGDTLSLLKLSEKVNLNAQGSGNPPPGDVSNAEAQVQLSEYAKSLVAQNKAKTFGEAFRLALSEKPDLAAKYRSATEVAAIVAARA